MSPTSFIEKISISQVDSECKIGYILLFFFLMSQYRLSKSSSVLIFKVEWWKDRLSFRPNMLLKYSSTRWLCYGGISIESYLDFLSRTLDKKSILKVRGKSTCSRVDNGMIFLLKNERESFWYRKYIVLKCCSAPS